MAVSSDGYDKDSSNEKGQHCVYVEEGLRTIVNDAYMRPLKVWYQLGTR